MVILNRQKLGFLTVSVYWKVCFFHIFMECKNIHGRLECRSLEFRFPQRVSKSSSHNFWGKSNRHGATLLKRKSLCHLIILEEVKKGGKSRFFRSLVWKICGPKDKSFSRNNYYQFTNLTTSLHIMKFRT